MIKSVKLGEIARVSSGGTPSRANPSYWNGNIPWVKTTQIQNCVITLQDVDEWITEEGLKNSSAKMVPAGTIVLGMIGQGKTRGQVGYLSFDACTNQNAATITCNNECDSWFIYQYLLFNYENIRALSNSSGQGNLNLGLVEIIPITLPPLSQQKKIANLLGTWDNAIEKTEALIAAKEKQFEWLCTNLLSGRKKSFGFTGKSIPTAFGSIFSLFKKVNTSCADYEVLSVTKDGIVSQSEYFNKEVASKDKSKYLIVDKDTLVMSGLNFWMGAIDFQTIRDTGIVSPAYKTFKVNEGPYNRDYLRFFIRSHYMTKILLDSSIQGASIVRRNLDMEWLSNSLIDLPNLEEQIDIANILSSAEKEIDGLKLLAEKYRSQKRGLMQKLLTGEWQVGSSQHLSEETYQETSA